MAIIAADIGGTHSRLVLIDLANNISVLQQKSYHNSDFQNFESLLMHFLGLLDKAVTVSSLVLAVPAPVISGTTRLTNLDWVIDEQELQERFAVDPVIINDLQAAALGTLSVPREELIAINDLPMTASGKRVVIGSGTGLGVAWLSHEGNVIRSNPTEAGHIDFASADAQQEDLHHFLQNKYGHVSWERILSGPGIVDLYRFCSGLPEADVSASWVNEQASAGNDKAAEEAMHLFARVYGAFAGNMVLTHRPIDGIFLVGGVSIKTRQWLQSDEFLQAFFDKGRMRRLAEETPVYLLPNEDNGLKGVIEYARMLAAEMKERATQTPPMNIVRSS